MTRTIEIVPGPRLGRAAATLAGYGVTVTQWPPRQAGLRPAGRGVPLPPLPHLRGGRGGRLGTWTGAASAAVTAGSRAQ